MAVLLTVKKKRMYIDYGDANDEINEHGVRIC